MGRRNLCSCPESLPALLPDTHSVASSNPQTLVIPAQASVHSSHFNRSENYDFMVPQN